MMHHASEKGPLIIYIIHTHSTRKRQVNDATPASDTHLQKHLTGILNVLLYLDQELHGLSAVKKTMVIGKCQVHHGTDLNLAIDDNWALLSGMKTKHGALGKVDDGGAHEGTEDTTVADGEGAASHVLNSELAVASLLKGFPC